MPHPPSPAFLTVEAAWFWTSATLRAREQRAAAPPGPCRAEDVIKCLDRLYRLRRIELMHVHILRRWGWRGRAPDGRCGMEAAGWREALACLDGPLRQRGIVACLANPAAWG